MERFEIEIAPRQETGSAASRRIRKAGFIPSVVYSGGESAVPVVISTKDFTQVAVKSKKSQLFVIKSSLDGINGRLALVKEVQIDSVKRTPKHVDFQALKADEEIIVRIAVKLIGEAPGVKTDGGILNVVTHDVGVKCLPHLIPSEIEVDISKLKLGEAIKAGEVKLPEGVKLADEADEPLVVVAAPQEEETASPAVAAGDVPTTEVSAPQGEGGDSEKKGK